MIHCRELMTLCTREHALPPLRFTVAQLGPGCSTTPKRGGLMRVSNEWSELDDHGMVVAVLKKEKESDSE